MAMDDAPHDEGTKQFSGAALSENLLTMNPMLIRLKQRQAL